jgi:uncharacterized iron-regulated membrane protein
MRGIFVILHRYAGLTMAIFLIVAGLTGSVIAFNHELDEWLNPDLFVSRNGGTPLPATELAALVEKNDPRVLVSFMSLEHEPGHNATIWVSPRIDPETGKTYPVEYNQVFVDPVSGEIIDNRFWGGCCFDRKQLIPFLYVLHFTLFLPENIGMWIMGIVAIIWMFDCFIGACLTFPKPNGRGFLAQWMPAWKIRGKGSAYQINFDLHRAGGLWFWGVLLMLAVSGVSLNLHEEVFEPTVSFFSPMTPTPFDERVEQPMDKPIMPEQSVTDIIASARIEIQKRGWQPPGAVFYAAGYGIYGVLAGKDHTTGLGNPWLYFDGITGEFLHTRKPGEGSAGDFFHDIQFPLHSGQIAGMGGRIVISVTGIVAAILSITGCIIWLRKFQGRQFMYKYNRANSTTEPANQHTNTVPS